MLSIIFQVDWDVNPLINYLEHVIYIHVVGTALIQLQKVASHIFHALLNAILPLIVFHVFLVVLQISGTDTLDPLRRGFGWLEGFQINFKLIIG